jgi:hypothetical protein
MAGTVTNKRRPDPDIGVVYLVFFMALVLAFVIFVYNTSP